MGEMTKRFIKATECNLIWDPKKRYHTSFSEFLMFHSNNLEFLFYHVVSRAPKPQITKNLKVKSGC